MSKINENELRKEHLKGNVTIKHHNTLPLRILNYTPKVQFKKLWTPLLTMCRGLVIDSDQNIVARPFPKFFNFSELPEDHQEYLVSNQDKIEWSEKIDGSLIIAFYYRSTLVFTTRGTFHSKQAEDAENYFYQRTSNHFNLDQNKTYCMEYCGKSSKIVVNYDDECLYLTGIFDVDGNEYEIDYCNFDFDEPCDFEDGINFFDEVKNPYCNKEGFVGKFTYQGQPYRFKLKYDEYVRLHRLVTGISEYRVWEYLASDIKPHYSIQSVTDNFLQTIDVPDELYTWSKNRMIDFLQEYDRIESWCSRLTFHTTSILKDRKEIALRFQDELPKYTSVCFAMLDNKPYSKLIWNTLKPKENHYFNKNFNNN